MVGPSAPFGSVQDHVRNMGDPWKRRVGPAQTKSTPRQRDYSSEKFVPKGDDSSDSYRDDDEDDEDDEDNSENDADFVRRITEKTKELRRSHTPIQNGLPAKPATQQSGRKFSMKRSSIKYTPSSGALVPVSRQPTESSTESSISNSLPTSAQRPKAVNGSNNGSRLAAPPAPAGNDDSSSDESDSDSDDAPAKPRPDEERVRDSRKRPKETRQSSEKLRAKSPAKPAVSRQRHSSLAGTAQTSGRPEVEVDDSEPEREKVKLSSTRNKRTASNEETSSSGSDSDSDSGVRHIKQEPIEKPFSTKQAPMATAAVPRRFSKTTRDIEAEDIKQEASGGADSTEGHKVKTPLHRQTRKSTRDEESESGDGEAGATKEKSRTKSTPARSQTKASAADQKRTSERQDKGVKASSKSAVAQSIKHSASAKNASPAKPSSSSRRPAQDDDGDELSDGARDQLEKTKRRHERARIRGIETGNEAWGYPYDTTSSTSWSEGPSTDGESEASTDADKEKPKPREPETAELEIKKTDASSGKPPESSTSTDEDDSESSDSSDGDEPTRASKQLLQESVSSSHRQAAQNPDTEVTDESSQVEEDNSKALVEHQPNRPAMIPPDFQLQRADKKLGASDVAQLLDEARLANKQLFYFTVPYSLPVTVVEQTEIAASSVFGGQPVVSHKGDEYGLSIDDAQGAKTIKILVPNEGGDQYSILGRDVEQTVHVKRITKYAPNADSVHPRADPGPSAPRPQPEGLKNRFLPLGIKAASPPREASPVLNDPDSPVPPDSQWTPASHAPSKTTKKRKHDGSADDASPRKRPQAAEKVAARKRKHVEEEDSESEEMCERPPPLKTVRPKKAKQPTTRRPAFPTQSESKMSAPPPKVNHVAAPRKVTPVPPPVPGKVAANAKPTVAKANPWASAIPTKQTAVPLPEYVRKSSSVARSSVEPAQDSSGREPPPEKKGKKGKTAAQPSPEKKGKKNKTAAPPSSGKQKETPIPVPTQLQRHVK